MSQKFRIKNDKGLFVELEAKGLMSVSTLEGLRKEILPIMEQGDYDICKKALEAVEKMPVMDAKRIISRFDPEFDPLEEARYRAGTSLRLYAKGPVALMPSYGWMVPGSAKGASKGGGIECANAKDAGWLGIAAVAAHILWINVMLKKASIAPIETYEYTGWKTAAKKEKELVFEPINECAELASSTAWMIFNGNGFLDAKGNMGPLGRARMFESAKAAANTANISGLARWKVVKGSVELHSLENFPGDCVPQRLAQAISMRESELLTQALTSASMEVLQKRLADLETQLSKHSKAAAEPLKVATAKKHRL